MRRLRVGIIGASALTEWALLPALSGPDAITPPDSGAWWGRRPGVHSEIQYQPPALPDVAAIADADEPRVRRVAEAARIRAVYTDWRQMLREVQLDALLCATGPDTTAEVLLAMRGHLGPRYVWVDGPPAPCAQAATDLEKLLAPSIPGRGLHLWCARPLRQAAAHRTAWRLLERKAIGPVAALSLRWGASLFRPHHDIADNNARKPLTPDDERVMASSFAAVDLLLAFAAPMAKDEKVSWDISAAPVAVCGSERHGAAALWMHFADGSAATALFSPSENWSSPLPRLEIVGTEGRSIVCEGGRRVLLHEPREAARLWEPPGLAAQISASNVVGVAEDVKAFLSWCVSKTRLEEQSERRPALESTIRALRVLEATAESLRTGRIVEVEPSGPRPLLEDTSPVADPVMPAVTGTLPFDWKII
jgi:predicted dehydrogenase